MGQAVSKIAQVAVGAVVGFAQGGPMGAAIGAGLALYLATSQDSLSTSSSLRDSEPSAQTVRSSKAPIRFILGRASTGGVLVWAQEQAGTQTTGELVHLVYVLSEGPVDALEDILLGEESISTFGDDASYELVVNPTAVNAFLLANCPDWKETQIGRGLSFVRLSLRYNAEKFPSGIPDVRFVVRGRNDIYDPRSGAVGYSQNTALHALWYLRNRCGIPDDEIIFETFASAANVCDEAVTNADGTVSQRYTSSCVIGADEQRTSVMQKLEAACAGKLIRVGGRWMLQVGAYYGPYDFEITEDMVIGTITGGTEPTNDAAINTVRGTFIDTTQAWAETDYPEVVVDDWVTQDGGEAAETLSFSYVIDPYQAQRLANIELRRRRAGGTISLPMHFAGYNCRPGRVVRLNLPSLNILGEFIVTSWNMGATEGCTVALAQYEQAIFGDAVGQPYNPLGFISLPAGGLGSPTGLTWTPSDSAEIVQGVLSWTPPAGIVSEYAVIVRQGTTAVQAQTVPASATLCNIAALASGNYTMSVAAIGPSARSGEATITVSISGPPIPEACVVQSTIDAITLIPSNTMHGLNGGTYEYFFSTNPHDSAAEAEYLGQGLTFTHTGLAFYTNYYYFVRSANAYGKSAFLSVPAATSNDVSAYLAAIAGQIDETALGQGLKDRIDLIDGPPDLPGSVNDRLNDLGTQVTEVTNQLQDQIDAIGEIADSAAYDPTKTYTVGQSVLAPDGKLYQAKGNVPANAAPPNTTYWTDVGQAVTDANGLAARVTTTETRLTSVEGVNTSQASQIDGLQSSLSGKADASAVNSLTTRVTAAENNISSQGTAITGLQNSMANKADASTVASLSNTVTQQGNTLTAQGTQLTSINATVTGVSQDNYVKDPTYAAGKAGFSNANVTIVDRTDSTVPANAPAARLAKWAAPTSTGNTYVRFTPQDNRLSNNAAGVQPLISAAPGEVYYFSADVFVESTRQVGLWIQPYTDGTQVGSAWLLPTSTSVSTAATANTWAKLSGKHTVAAGINGLAISIRVSSGDAVNVWVANLRWTKETVEQAGAAAATSALDARVTQTEAGLTSQGSQITSLTNSLAGKADNSALQALASTVSQQGSTLDSQGSAVTQLQSTISGIAGAGTNLLPDDYSWLTSTTLPTTIVNTLTRVGVAVAAASSGFGIKMTLGSAITTQFLMLAPTNNAAGYNIDMEAGNYLVSMYVQGSAAGTMRVSMYNGSHRYSANVAYTTTRQRLTFVCTATAFARAAITIYPNMSALAAGTEITIDSVMIEEQVGTGTTPSAFVAGPSARAIAAQATAISTLDTRVTQTETTITAQASRLDGLYVQINPATAGDSTTYAGSASVFAGVWSEQSARIEDGIATAQRVDTVQASVTDTTNALVQTNASVQQTSQAVATLDGKVSATWSVKLQVNANGQYVAAGIGLGIENTAAGLQSQFLVSADRFAIVGTLAGGTSYTPFVVQAGQVFMNSAFIQDGTITNAKIGNYIQSNNFVAGSTGWRLYFDGTFEINSALGGGGRQVINGAGGKVFDASGVKRYQWGNLDA